jgi:4a-hydroxytetrahydrobiopterin dehydratase
MTRPPLLEPETLNEWLTTHPQWLLAAGHLVREVATIDYPNSVRIIEAQVGLAEDLDHHPVILLGYRSLRFEVWTHDRGGLTELDLDYARGLDEILEQRFGDVIA